MTFQTANSNIGYLAYLRGRSVFEIQVLCKYANDYLNNGLSAAPNEQLANTTKNEVDRIVESLILLLIDSNKLKRIKELKDEIGLSLDVLEILTQFVNNGCSRLPCLSSNFTDYRLVLLEWRLEARLASRKTLQPEKVINIKLHLYIELVNSNIEVLQHCQYVNKEDRKNHKKNIVKIHVSSLLHITQILEGAIEESTNRRIRNITSPLY